MDETLIYVKMCDCTEVQDNRPDMPWNCHEFYGYRFYYTELMTDDFLIWLPRQDQIQDMFFRGGHWKRLEQLLDPFFSYYNRQPWAGKADATPPTMEQLWLAFYMKEKHNKVWDGEKWKLYE